MRLRKNTIIYDELWKNGATPDMTEIKGIFYVEVCSGIIPNLPRWRKEIFEEEIFGVRCGKNIFGRRDTVFGSFKASIQLSYTRDDDTKVLMLEYDDGNILDYLVEIRRGLYLGKFYWRKRFYAYFWLYQSADELIKDLDELLEEL